MRRILQINITSSISGTPGFAAHGETISLPFTQGTAGSTGHPATAAGIGFSQIGTYSMRMNLGAYSDAQFSVRINSGTATVFTAAEIRDWNSGTTNENLAAAGSHIHDADMATEMIEYAKENIFSQAVTAMLAQANQRPQQVLQLLG